jgi:hypothetical protein
VGQCTHAAVAAEICHFIADAIADLGKPEEINRVFVGFQKYLYKAGSDRNLAVAAGIGGQGCPLYTSSPTSKPHQISKLPHFSKSPLRFFPFIWYKQFTESSVWLARRIVCNSRRAPGI